MPFGKKKDEKGREIDFDTIYDMLIQPAIEDAGMEAVRADEEMVGGFIHKPMYERLLLCDYAIADLTTANANVFYELGIRHAARPHHTLSIFLENTTLPFDVRPLRSCPYKMDKNQNLSQLNVDKKAITKWLIEAKKRPTTDSPLFQFFDDLTPQNISHEKTDIFRDQVEYSIQAKKSLALLRENGDLEGIKSFESSLDFDVTEGGVLIDIYLSYRALDAWDEMIALETKMPKYLQRTLLIREQLAFALNRIGRSKEAEIVLLDAIEEYGNSGETLGLLGRVYKDRWKNETNEVLKESWLYKAIDTYVKGYEADIRDAYPGINAITLMSLLDEVDPRLEALLPVVLFAVQQRLSQKNPDYWDYVTLMELEVIARNPKKAKEILIKALPLADEKWMKETTQATMAMLRDKWRDQGEDVDWLDEIVEGLE
jgi:tetratricopeptide (TPR) repeat protein